MIEYVASAQGLTAEQLTGFFVGWPNPPKPQTHLRLLQRSDHVIMALDQRSGQVVGFITAMTDKVLFAYIPLLEVLPQYKGRGIGQELVKRMLETLNGYYQIDVTCDPEVQPFYAKLRMQPSVGMTVVNFTKQSGE